MSVQQEKPSDALSDTPLPPEDRRFLRRVALFDGLSILFLLALAALWYAPYVLLLIFACILFSILLYDVSARLQRTLRIPRPLALALLIVAALLLCGAAGWYLSPQIVEQARDLAAALPKALQSLRQGLEQFGFLGQFVNQLPSNEEIFKQLTSLLSKPGLLFSGLLGVLGNILIILFVGVYFAAQPHLYINGIITLIPPKKRQRAREVLDEIGRTLSLWLVGKLCAMLVVGILSAIGLTLLGVPLALILGILAGLLDFIPYLGPVIAGVPAVLMAFSESPTLALYTILLFAAVQFGESYLLTPLVERRMVSLPPALTILMQVLLGTLFGLAGVALATPLTAVLTVLITMLYVQDVLGDPVKTPSER